MAAQARKLRAVPAKPTTSSRGRGRPKTRLTSAIGANGSEREKLVILRSMVAKRLEEDLPATAFNQLLTRFNDYDKQISAIDAREADANSDDDDEGLDDGDDSFDPGDI